MGAENACNKEQHTVSGYNSVFTFIPPTKKKSLYPNSRLQHRVIVSRSVSWLLIEDNGIQRKTLLFTIIVAYMHNFPISDNYIRFKGECKTHRL